MNLLRSRTVWQFTLLVYLISAGSDVIARDFVRQSLNSFAPTKVGLTADSSVDSSYTAGGGIRSFSTTAAGIKSTVSNLFFEIPDHRFEARPDRLIDRQIKTETLSLRNDDKGPFKDYRDFKTRGLNDTPTTVRSYGVRGLSDVRIVLPESYAKRLDESKMVSKDPGTGQDSQRVAPSDLPQLIDEMPDPRYFKRILLSDQPNPEDDWVTQSYFSKGFVSATAMVDGELFLYKSNLTDYLRRDLMHEWSHELRYKYWNDPVRDLFHDAVLLETQWNPRQYAARGDSEQWAVLGEKLLGTSANDFVEACDRAPIRTTLWLITLKKCLDNVPKPLWTADHSKYAERVAYVAQKVKSTALASLTSMRTAEKDPARVQALNRLTEKISSVD